MSRGVEEDKLDVAAAAADESDAGSKQFEERHRVRRGERGELRSSDGATRP